jgi:hypothetical protein
MWAQLRERLASEIGELVERVRSWEELGDEQQYQALLTWQLFLGVQSRPVLWNLVNEFVQECLWDARQLVIHRECADRLPAMAQNSMAVRLRVTHT